MPFFKNVKKISKMFSKFWNHAFAVDPAWFWNDWMNTVADAILSYYILYRYFKISKIYQKFMRPSNQVQAVMLIYYRRAKHNFQTIEWKSSEMHLSLTIYYTTISKLPKICQKKKRSDLQKKHKSGGWYHSWCLYEIWKLSD